MWVGCTDEVDGGGGIIRLFFMNVPVREENKETALSPHVNPNNFVSIIYFQ